LLGCPALIVEPNNRPAWQGQVRHDKAHSWE
jgi:hypothetical protein